MPSAGTGVHGTHRITLAWETGLGVRVLMNQVYSEKLKKENYAGLRLGFLKQRPKYPYALWFCDFQKTISFSRGLSHL